MASLATLTRQRRAFGELFPEPAAHYALTDRYSTNQTVCRVRRSSDNAESDVTSHQIGAWLADWVGAGNDGFVTTWYDLTSNGNDASQSTAGSQPKIIDSGSLVVSGGRPSIRFDGSDDLLEAPDDASFDFSSYLSVFAIAQHDTEITSGVKTLFCKYNSGNDEREWLLAIDSSNDGIALYVGATGGSSFETVVADTSTDETTRQLIGAGFASGSVTLYKNGGSLASTASGSLPSTLVNDASPLIIGAQASGTGYSAANHWGGPMTELIAYGTDQSANRADIDAWLLQQHGIS